MDDKTIVPNAPWAEFFCARYARLVEGLRTGAFEKVQPAFKDIEAEAEAAAEAGYERLGALPSDGETDMGDVAEQDTNMGSTRIDLLYYTLRMAIGALYQDV